MKKMVKVLVGIVGALVAVMLAVVLTLPFWISPLVKTAASVGGPKVLGAPVSVGDVTLSPLSGALTISKLNVGNPQGFSDKPAFAVDKVAVALDLASLAGDTIRIKRIQIDAPNISFESQNGRSNFDALLANAKRSESEEKAKKPEADKEKKPAKKVVIETFELNGAQVSCTAAWTFGKPVTLPLPSVALHDIGKESGGATPVEAVAQVFNGITSSLGQAVTALAGKADGLLKDALKSAGGATQGVTGAAQGAADAPVSAAKDAEGAVKDAAKSLKKLFK